MWLSTWEEFCSLILGKKLHHHPARGGKIERAEFHHLYIQTIASYRQYFGTPPQDIWSPPDIRFGKELKLVHQEYLHPNVRNRTFAIANPLTTEANYLEH